MEKVKIMLDTVRYKNKPHNPEQVNNRIIKNPVELTIKDLADQIKNGKSFIPANLSTKNGRIKRSKEYWESQDLICLDFDEGMNIEEALFEFNNVACIIYKTFSHRSDKHKFRVIMKTSRSITDQNEYNIIIKHFLNKYTNADSACRDSCRIFYGTNNDIEMLNTINKLDIDDILSNTIESDNCSPSNLEDNRYTTTIYNILPFDGSITKKYFNHINDAYQEIYKMNLAEYINSINPNNNAVIGNFNCIFHKEEKPSASIFKHETTGSYIYKCHSEKCGFIGNIVRVTERLLNMNRINAYHHLCNLYNIEVVETEWQKQQKEILDHNISFLGSKEFEVEHPILYKKIKRYIPFLIMINMISKQYVGTSKLEEIERNIFYASRRSLSELTNIFKDLIAETHTELEYKKINSDTKEIGKRIDLFSFLGLINKIHINDLPPELKKSARRIKMGSGYSNFTNFYAVDQYDDKCLTEANSKTKKLKENNVAMAGFGRESLLRNVGEKEADEAFPMLQGKKIHKNREKISDNIKSKFLKRIKEYGYAIESHVLEELIAEHMEKPESKHKSTSYHIANIKTVLNELIESYDLSRKRLTKKMKQEYKLEHISGCPFVLIPNKK